MLAVALDVEKLDWQIHVGSREPNRLTTFTCCWLALLAGWLLGGWLGRSAGWVDLPAVVRSTLLHFRIVAGPSGKIGRSDISDHVEELFVRFGSKSRQQFWYVFSPLQFNTRCLKFDRYQPLAARNSKLQINFAHDEIVQSVMLCKRNENMPHDSNKLVERVKLLQIGVPSLQNECTMLSEMSNL